MQLSDSAGCRRAVPSATKVVTMTSLELYDSYFKSFSTSMAWMTSGGLADLPQHEPLLDDLG
jgi:hypothetical protein